MMRWHKGWHSYWKSDWQGSIEECKFYCD